MRCHICLFVCSFISLFLPSFDLKCLRSAKHVPGTLLFVWYKINQCNPFRRQLFSSVSFKTLPWQVLVMETERDRSLLGRSLCCCNGPSYSSQFDICNEEASQVSFRSTCFQGCLLQQLPSLSTKWSCKKSQIVPFRLTERFSIFFQLNLIIQEIIFTLKNANFILEHSIENEATSFQAICLKCCHYLSRSNFGEFLLKESKEFVKMLSGYDIDFREEIF